VRIPSTIVALVASALGIVPAAAAQADATAALSPAEIATACAPPVAATHAAHALRVIGAQHKTPRTIFDDRDFLIVNGGTAAGVQVGSVFFVRRTSDFGTAYMGNGTDSPVSTITDGWIRIVSVNDTTALARAEHVCGAIFAGDVLEPYAAPQVAVELPPGPTPTEVDFQHLGRVVSGAAGRRIASAGEFAIFDNGDAQDLRPGARVAIYRDLTHPSSSLMAPAGTPLTAIAEAVVVSTSGGRTLARIVRGRDAVETGDYVALAK
jgi:hypothetical protein